MSRTSIPALVVAAALAASVIAAAPAQAETVLDFDAPLLGTTATLQTTRLATASDVTCSDAACTSGIFRTVTSGGFEYSSVDLMRDAGYTRPPQFRRGISQSWYDATAADADVAYMTVALAEYAPGSDMVSVATSVAALGGITLSPMTVDGVDVLVGESVNASDTDNVYTGSAFKSAVVIGTDSMVRAGCQLGGAQVAATTCTTANLAQLAVKVSRQSPLDAVPGQAKINRLLPDGFPAGMRPLVLASATAEDAWVPSISNEALLAELDKSPSAVTQFTLRGAPRMGVTAVFSALEESSMAKGFIARKCESTATRVCKTTRLQGGIGYQNLSYDKGTKRDSARLTFVGAGNGRLVSVGCYKRKPTVGAMTVKEQAMCTTAAKELLKETVK